MAIAHQSTQAWNHAAPGKRPRKFPAYNRWLAIGAGLCLAFVSSLTLVYQDDIRFGVDALSYIEHARDIQGGKYEALSNAYWSPLYPLLLSIGMPQAPDLLPSRAHLLTWQLIQWCGLIAAFCFYLSSLLRLRPRAPSRETAMWTIGSFALFISFHSKLYLLTHSPDLLVAMVIFVAGGIVARTLLDPNRLSLWVLLGIVLAVGYFSKSMLFPASGLLLVLLTVLRWRGGLSVSPPLVAGIVFLVTTSPLWLTISMRAGGLSFGDSGRLNYAWHVNQYEKHFGWTGAEPGSGMPRNPVRVLSQDPAVYEFSTPGGGTFPLWKDPAHWHEGVVTRLSFSQVASNVVTNIRAIWRALAVWPLILLPSLILRWKAGPGAYQGLFGASCLFIWPSLIIGAYCLVASESRYIVPLVVSAMLSALWLSLRGTLLGRMVFHAQLFCLLAASLWMAGSCLRNPAANPFSIEGRWSYTSAVEEYLRNSGIGPGHRIATTGRQWEMDNLFWARRLGVQVASVVKTGQPDRIPEQKWAEILLDWKRLKIDAIVFKCLTERGEMLSPDDTLAECHGGIPAVLKMQRVARTPYYVRILKDVGMRRYP